MKIKGTLRLERKIIDVLLTISVTALILGGIIEYILPLFVTEEILNSIHHQFVINILLGASCSALISWLCLWGPFLAKKHRQELELIRQVKELYCAYEQLYNVINANRNSEEENNIPYSGEVHLNKVAVELEKQIKKLVETYRESDVIFESVEKIVNKKDDIFIPIAEVTKYFTTLLVPEEYLDNIEMSFNAGPDIKFNREKNRALYEQLLHSLENVISHDEVCKLFEECIELDVSILQNLNCETVNILKSVQRSSVQNKIRYIKMEMSAKIMEIQLRTWNESKTKANGEHNTRDV